VAIRFAAVVVSAIAAFVAASTPVMAQDNFPSRPITMVVPFPPGGSTDAIARIVGEGMRQQLGQPVIIDNRAGAGGMLGTGAVVRSAPDGTTIGMGTASTLAINQAVMKAQPYDVLTDLVAIGNIVDVPNIMSLNPNVPAKNMAELIALAKRQPGKLAYATPGPGTVGHVIGEQFKLSTGTDLLHVPYRGMGAALNDAIAGQVQVIYDNLPTSLELVKSGKLRALAISADKRVAALPDTPTFGELGLDEINWMGFFGLVAPKGTPPAIIRRLNGALVAALAKPDIREKLIAQQSIVVGNSPEQFQATIVREVARMKRAAAAAKIEVN
jgi:tripartite-type tricarboxylate transporter receptor subunit TctC